MDKHHLGKLSRRQAWRDMVVRCQSSGLSVRNWCEQAGMTPSTYYYRQQQVLQQIPPSVVHEHLSLGQTASTARFVPLTIDSSTDKALPAKITIQFNGVHVAIEPGVDAATLTTVLQSIERLC